jgi:hypothetical protein
MQLHDRYLFKYVGHRLHIPEWIRTVRLARREYVNSEIRRIMGAQIFRTNFLYLWLAPVNSEVAELGYCFQLSRNII